MNRDTTLKSGQIAHIDKNNKNNYEDNLCFLCLDHHDEYDSTASQRKNFTIHEVKAFRKELYTDIGKAFSLPVHFGDVSFSPSDPYAGQFIRIGTDSASAEIILTPVPDGIEGLPRYHVSGFALWGESREYGPNMGELSIIGIMYENGKIEYRDHSGKIFHKVILSFDGDNLRVDEENWFGQYGMNVNFIGAYRRGNGHPGNGKG